MAAFDRVRKIRDGYTAFIDAPASGTNYDFELPGYLLSDGAASTSTGGAKVRPAVAVQRLTFDLIASAGTTSGQVAVTLREGAGVVLWQVQLFGSAGTTSMSFPQHFVLSDYEKGGVLLVGGTPQFIWTGGDIAAGGFTVKQVSIDYQVFDSSIC